MCRTRTETIIQVTSNRGSTAKTLGTASRAEFGQNKRCWKWLAPNQYVVSKLMIETVMHKFFFSEGSVSLKKCQTEADGFRVSESYFGCRCSPHPIVDSLSIRNAFLSCYNVPCDSKEIDANQLRWDHVACKLIIHPTFVSFGFISLAWMWLRAKPGGARCGQIRSFDWLT